MLLALKASLLNMLRYASLSRRVLQASPIGLSSRRVVTSVYGSTGLRQFTPAAATATTQPLDTELPRPSLFSPLPWEDEPGGFDEMDWAELQQGVVDPHTLKPPASTTRPVLPKDHSTKDLRTRQLELEMLAVERTLARYRQLSESVSKMRDTTQLGRAQHLIVRWFEPLEIAIDREQAAVMAQESGTDRNIYGPLLLLLPPDQLAAITVHEMLHQTLRFVSTNVRVYVCIRVCVYVSIYVYESVCMGVWVRLCLWMSVLVGFVRI